MYWKSSHPVLCKGLVNEGRVKGKKSSVACRYSDDLFAYHRLRVSFQIIYWQVKKKEWRNKKLLYLRLRKTSLRVSLFTAPGLFPISIRYLSVRFFFFKNIYFGILHSEFRPSVNIAGGPARTLLSPTMTAGRHTVYSGCCDRGTRARYIRSGAPCTCATESIPVCDVRASVNHDWIGNFILDGNLLYGRWLPGAERFKN